jgi:hypothetical protein
MLKIILFSIIVHFTFTCNRIAFFSHPKPEQEEGNILNHADIYYVYGYSLINNVSYSAKVNKTLLLPMIQHRVDEPFLFYENEEDHEIQILFQNYESLKYKQYATLKDSKNHSQYLIVIDSNITENMVFLHTCKVVKRSNITKSYNVRVLWVEGKKLLERVEYKRLWDISPNITIFNITGLKYYTEKCDQFVTFLDGCKVKLDGKNFYFALVIGMFALLSFLGASFYCSVKNDQRYVRKIFPIDS